MSEDDIQERIREQLKPQLPKRFYKKAIAVKQKGGYCVQLDGRPLPGLMPARNMAEAVAGEWESQSEVVDPALMPLTRLVNIANEQIAGDPVAAIDEIMKYAASDLLCYRAEEPQQLVARQDEIWDPVLELVNERFDAGFEIARGVTHKPQPPQTLEKLKSRLETRDAFGLSAVHSITALTGSAILAICVAENLISPQDAWAAAHVDEDWQIARWGEDAEALARRDLRWRDMDTACKLLCF